MAKNDATPSHRSSSPNNSRMFAMNKKSRDENNIVDSASKSEPAGREEASCGETSGQVVAGPARTDVKDEDEKQVNTVKKSNGLLSAIRALFGWKEQHQSTASPEQFDLAAKRRAERNVSAGVAAKYGIELPSTGKVRRVTSSPAPETAAAVELRKARRALDERGDKLSTVAAQSEKMASEAQNLATTARLLVEKHRH